MGSILRVPRRYVHLDPNPACVVPPAAQGGQTYNFVRFLFYQFDESEAADGAATTRTGTES